MSAYWPSLYGGLLLGLAATLLLLLNGRIAGISGILGRCLGGERRLENGAFLAGLLLGPLLYRAVFGAAPAVTLETAWPLILLAGLLVGYGTRLGSGCTSGHGILGLARLSRRSLAATLTFTAFGMLTATAMGWLR